MLVMMTAMSDTEEEEEADGTAAAELNGSCGGENWGTCAMLPPVAPVLLPSLETLRPQLKQQVH